MGYTVYWWTREGQGGGQPQFYYGSSVFHLLADLSYMWRLCRCTIGACVVRDGEVLLTI